MLRHRDLSFDDYLAVLQRRRWAIIIPAVLGPLVGYLITLFLTPTYTSQSLILIEQPKVPETFVKSVVTSDLFERLATMQEQILSRTRLQPLIERYDLYKSERRRSMEDAVEEMRKSILVTPVEFASDIAAKRKPGPPGTQAVPGFSITFTAESGQLAQQVCQDLTSMFLAENLRQREERAQGTTDFISNQLAEAKRKLEEQDAKLAEFKRRNIGELPDDQQANLQVLTAVNNQLTTITDSLNRAQQDKVFNESLLDQELAAWQSSVKTSAPSQTLQDELSKMEDYLVTLETRYTGDHPDVIKLKNDIAKLQKTIAEQGAADKDKADKTKAAKAAQPGLEPPQIQKLRAQIALDEQFIRVRTRELDRVQQQMNTYQSRLQLSPVVEEQFKNLTRDYETALKFYNKLLADKDQSEMSTDLERRQEGEQFRVLDSPNTPKKPSFPDPLIFAGGGLGAGLALGLGIVLVVELRDKSIRDERDIEFYLQLPTLALVPSLGNLNGKQRGIFKRAKKQETLPRSILQA